MLIGLFFFSVPESSKGGLHALPVNHLRHVFFNELLNQLLLVMQGNFITDQIMHLCFVLFTFTFIITVNSQLKQVDDIADINAVTVQQVQLEIDIIQHRHFFFFIGLTYITAQVGILGSKIGKVLFIQYGLILVVFNKGL